MYRVATFWGILWEATGIRGPCPNCRPFRPGFSQTLNGYRDRRFTIEDTLFSIRDSWKEGVEAAMAQLPDQEKAAFKANATRLLSKYRAALQDEKGLLTEAISLGQQIQITLLARMDTLNELERFIRSRVFWLRDDKPIGVEALKPIGSEIGNYTLAATITNQATDEAIEVVFETALNDTLEIDTDERTVTYLADESSQFQAVSMDSVRRHWLRLLPGYNTLRFDDAGLAAVTVFITFQRRYY